MLLEVVVVWFAGLEDNIDGSAGVICGAGGCL